MERNKFEITIYSDAPFEAIKQLLVDNFQKFKLKSEDKLYKSYNLEDDNP